MKLPVNEQVVVLGTGSYVPDRVITNEVLRDLCATGYDEASGDFSTWVDRVTHIHERRYIADETVAVMGTVAAREALDMAGVKATDLDLIILQTAGVGINVDTIDPRTAAEVVLPHLQ